MKLLNLKPHDRVSTNIDYGSNFLRKKRNGSFIRYVKTKPMAPKCALILWDAIPNKVAPKTPEKIWIGFLDKIT